MKLVLADNQTPRFVDFYRSLRNETNELFDYSGYNSLLYLFDSPSNQPIKVINLATGRSLDEYDGVYINGYLRNYELAAATAIACRKLGLKFVNQELDDPPSLSKLSMYAKLAAAGICLPKTIAGTKAALTRAKNITANFGYPAVLKRADADRGIDNYLIKSASEALKILEPQPEESLWVLQSFIPNDGFYLVSLYNQQPAFCIYRVLKERPDGDERKAHMYKPKGGSNANLLELQNVPASILDECVKAAKAMKRQIASVDCIYDPKQKCTYILEVNYNPQLVTIETFKEIRVKAFTDYLNQMW